jgi:hypothetical protein
MPSQMDVDVDRLALAALPPTILRGRAKRVVPQITEQMREKYNPIERRSTLLVLAKIYRYDAP